MRNTRNPTNCKKKTGRIISVVIIMSCVETFAVKTQTIWSKLDARKQRNIVIIIINSQTDIFFKNIYCPMNKLEVFYFNFNK